MDRISSSPYFNPAQLYQQQQLARSQPNPQHPETESVSGAGRPAESPDFSGMFDDDSLLKLQSNLESIAQMAESALKRFEK